MKTLVISDTHLDLPFDRNKFSLLEKIISQSDRVIINGDFWEGYLLSFDEFFSSEWSQLFPLLKAKKTVYIFGNHDAKEYSDQERLNAFSDIQTHRYEYRVSDKIFIFEHGHRLLPFDPIAPDVFDPVFRKNVRRIDQFEKFLIRLGGSFYQIFFKGFNTKIKRGILSELRKNEIYVCGHTHCPEVTYGTQFINSGIIKHGLAQYLIIEKDGTITYRQERY